MSGFLNRINLMISRYLSNRLLMREQWMLLSIMACMLAVSSLSSVFINIFLYSMASETINSFDGIEIVAAYNLMAGAISFLSCFLLGITAKKMTYRVSMIIGVVFHAIFYFLVAVLNINIYNHIFVVSVFAGLGTTFFYLSYYSLVNIMITGLAKKQYIMFQSIISVAVGIVLPLISGMIIFITDSAAGYVIVFGLCAALCVLCVFICSRLPKIRGQSKQTYFANVFLKSFTKRKYLAVSMCDVLRGLKEGVVSFFIPVILYQVSKSVLVVGIYLAVNAVFGLLGNSLLTKLNIYKHSIPLMFASVIIQFAVLCVLIFEINVITVFIFGVTAAVLAPMYITPAFMTYYSTLEALGPSVSRRGLETSCVKEIYFNMGRIAAIALLMITVENTIITMCVVAILFAMQIISCIVSTAFKRQTKQEEM